DILNHWKKEGGDWSWGILDIVDLNEPLARHAKPGAWNDPDMLQVGNFGGNRSPNENEYRSHMSLWCIMAAPIIMGNDIRNMNQATKDILLNKEVIAVNQDSAGIQGTKIKSQNGLDVWCKPLGAKDGDSKAVALFNRNDNTQNITVNFSDIGLSGEVHVRDLWKKEDKGLFEGSFSMPVEAHNTAMLKIVKPTVIRAERALTEQKKSQFSSRYVNGNIIISSLVEAKPFEVAVFLTDGRQVAHMNNVVGQVSVPAVKNSLYIVSITAGGYIERKTVSLFR
ncbi:MAG: hypothetical protein JW863_14110, partial [Chitinispirillaceae bacterium]|nr:hypothetical protein [Chitinispirillaceae bacterium]